MEGKRSRNQEIYRARSEGNNFVRSRAIITSRPAVAKDIQPRMSPAPVCRRSRNASVEAAASRERVAICPRRKRLSLRSRIGLSRGKSSFSSNGLNKREIGRPSRPCFPPPDWPCGCDAEILASRSIFGRVGGVPKREN
jgi:hypothetical protein